MTPHESVEFLADYTTSNACKHIYLVTGKTSFRVCGAEDALRPYLKSVPKLSHFDAVPKNPHIESVELAASLANGTAPDLVIAIGGGSAMDLAKALALRLASGKSTEECLAPEVAQATTPLPVIAIPTTTGTGSEVTRFAVIYRGKTKHSISSPDLIPKHALLVPEFTLAQPPSVRRAAAFDALTQACESFWAQHSTDASEHHALEAIKLLTPRLATGLQPFGLDEAHDVQLGSHLAGKAIDTTRTTAPHALSYALTMDYGVDHGHAVGLLFPKIWRLHLDLDARQKLPEALMKRMKTLSDALGVGAPQDVPAFWEGLLTSNELNFRFTDLGIKTREQWSVLYKRVNVERLSNHPCSLTMSDLDRLWNFEITPG